MFNDSIKRFIQRLTLTVSIVVLHAPIVVAQEQPNVPLPPDIPPLNQNNQQRSYMQQNTDAPPPVAPQEQAAKAQARGQGREVQGNSQPEGNQDALRSEVETLELQNRLLKAKYENSSLQGKIKEAENQKKPSGKIAKYLHEVNERRRMMAVSGHGIGQSPIPYPPIPAPLIVPPTGMTYPLQPVRNGSFSVMSTGGGNYVVWPH